MPLPKTLEKLKLDPRVSDVFAEDNNLDGDGRPDYWVYLTPGYWNPYLECHAIHETRVRDIMSQMKGVELCQCNDCVEYRKKKFLDEHIVVIKVP